MILDVTTRNSPVQKHLKNLIVIISNELFVIFSRIYSRSSSCWARNLRADISANVQPPMNTTTVNLVCLLPELKLLVGITAISESSSTVGPGINEGRESFSAVHKDGFSRCWTSRILNGAYLRTNTIMAHYKIVTHYRTLNIKWQLTCYEHK